MVSEYSSVIKSNPYVVPFDLNLATQVMMYKENQYKQNAASIQSAMEQAASLDLKEADKAKLSTKLQSTVSQLNQLSGLDLGSTNVANQLRGVVSGLYDEDLVTGLALKKNYNELNAYYDKVMSDPKLQKLWSPANYQADMREAQSWLSDPNPTSGADKGKVPSSPSPFINMGDRLTQITKDLIKPNVTEHPTIKGWYIDKTTNEELSPADLENRYRGYISNDPTLMRQAQINAQYLYPNRTSEDLFTSIHANLDAGLKDIDENITKTTASMIGLQGADLERYQNHLKVLKTNRDAYVKRKQETTQEKIQQNLDGYRTGDYIDALVQSHANLASFQKYKIETKLNDAFSKQAELQLNAAKEGLTIQIDPNGNPIIAVDPALQEAMRKKSSSSSTGSISAGEPAGDVISYGVSTDTKGGQPDKPKTADEVLARTVELSKQNHAAWQQLIKNAVASDPNAKALFGSEDKASEEIVRATLNYGYDVSALDVEDIKMFSKTDKGAKMAYLTELSTAFDDLKSGKTPSRNLKESDVQALTDIHDRTVEQNILLDIYNKSIGGSVTAVLTPDELKVVKDQKANPSAYKPTRITKYDWFKANNVELNNFLNGPTADVAKWVDKQTSRKVDPKNSLNVILSNGKYYPADGKDYSFERNVYDKPYGDAFDKPNTKKLVETKTLTIPKGGIDARIVNSFVQSKPGDAVLGADESKDLLELNIISTKKQQDFFKAQDKLKNRVADTKALDFLNQTPNFKSWYYAGDAPIQKSMEFSKAKAKLMGELDAGTYPEGKYILYKPEGDKKMVPTNLVGPTKTVDALKNLNFNDAKILRIGKTGERGWKMSDNSIEVEFEVPEQKVGSKSGTLGPTGKTSKIVATLSHQEVQEALGIKFPSKTQQIIQYSIDYYGRTPEMIVKPTSVSVPNLTMGMFIVKDQGTPGGPINYVPQIKIPRADNPNESDFYFLNDFTAASPAIVQAQVQAFLNNVAKTQKGSLNNQLYPLTNTSELFQFFKAKYSQ